MQHIILASNDLVETDINVFKVVLIVRDDSRFASLLPPFSHSQTTSDGQSHLLAFGAVCREAGSHFPAL